MLVSAPPTLEVSQYCVLRDNALEHFRIIDYIISNEESKSMTETIFNEYKTLISNQISSIGAEKLELGVINQQNHSRIVEGVPPPQESFIMEVDGALKINLKTLVQNLSHSASAQLEVAYETSKILLKEIEELQRKILSEDPNTCTKMDLLAETENIQEKIVQYSNGIKNSLNLYKNRETQINELILKISKKDDPLYQNQIALNDFLFQVVNKVPVGGPESVHLFKQEAFNDFGEQQFGIGENTVNQFSVIENEQFLYYGEIRNDDQNKILGKGIKVFKANGEMFEGWHQNEQFMTGKGRWIGGRSKKIYKGELYQNKSHGEGELYMASGDCYKGGFANDRYQGFGTYYRVDGRYRQGYYVQSKIQGEGKIQYPDGSFQVGMFVDNELEGEVILTQRDGRRYRQVFIEGAQQNQNELIQ